MESSLSRVIRPLSTAWVICATLTLVLPHLLCAAEATLSWEVSTDPKVVGYKIYYDTDTAPPYRPDPADYADEGPPPILVDKDKTRVTLHGLTDSKEYFFSVTAYYGSSGSESEYSEEASIRATGIRVGRVQGKTAEQAVRRPQDQHQEPDQDLGAVVRAGDYISVDTPAETQLSQPYDVDPDGYIHMPLLGKIKVDGLTVSDLQQYLVGRLQRYIKNVEPPSIKILASKRFLLIEGGVRYSGWYHVPQKVPLDELLRLAGGLLHGVDSGQITIKRRVGNTHQTLKAEGMLSLSTSDILDVPLSDRQRHTVDAGDLLFVRIPEQPSEDTRVVENYRQSQIEVDRFGYIALPIFGNIDVQNKATEDIEAFLTSKLPKYLSHSSKAQVSIIEKRHYIQVLGHVQKPGWYNVAETASVQMALDAAGGATDGAIMSDVTVQRKVGREIRSFRVNLYQYTVAGDERLLLPLQENDSVFVPISAAFGNVKRSLGSWNPPESRLEKESGKKVRIIGAVHAPGVYEPTAEMNLFELLVLARGETADADLSNIQVIRDNKMLRYNVKQLLEDSKELPKIQNGDMIRVPYMEREGYIKVATVEKARIIGAINKPGGYEITKDMTLLDFIAFADGQTPEADMSNITIVREDGAIDKFNMEEFFNNSSTRPLKELPRINPGDLVQVNFMERAGYIKAQNIYVLGKVRSPGVYELDEGMGVLQALARAGGLDEWANTKRITILRRSAGKQENIPFNFHMGISGKYPELNIRLKPDDLVYVP